MISFSNILINQIYIFKLNKYEIEILYKKFYRFKIK
jgi:hypothetical protein